MTHRTPPLITGIAGDAAPTNPPGGGIDGDAAPTDLPHGGIDGDAAPTDLPHGGIDGDAVGAGFIPALPTQNISNICGTGEMITDKVVRAGINTAPTNPPAGTLDHGY